jgi:CBS domain-containing protein
LVLDDDGGDLLMTRVEGDPVLIVNDVVRRLEPSVREHTDLAVALDALVVSGLGSLPVLGAHGVLTGVVSEGDLLRFAVGRQHDGAHRTHLANREDAYRHVVADVMTRSPVTATEEQPLDEIAQLFVRVPWRMLPVVRLGLLVGVVTRTDVVRALVGAESAPPVRSEPLQSRP